MMMMMMVMIMMVEHMMTMRMINDDCKGNEHIDYEIDNDDDDDDDDNDNNYYGITKWNSIPHF